MDWPIHEASVRVLLPGAVAPERVRHETFTGSLGSTSTRATDWVEESSYHAEVTRLGPGEGLTIVLGVADQWAERFTGLLSEPPKWFHSDTFAPGRFHPASLVASIGNGMNVMGRL